MDLATTDPHTRSWTRDEYYRMAEAGLFINQRVELIKGEILTMSPMNAAHAASLQLVARQLGVVFPDNYCVRVQLPLNLSAESQPEPDAAVVPGTPRDYLSHPETALLVVEVSDTTLAFDRSRKCQLYAAAGIPEYWIVNLVDHCLEVHDEPQDKEYRRERRYEAGDQFAPRAATDITIRVADLLP